MRKFLFLLILILPPISHGIGRSGNGRIADPVDGFTAEIPEAYSYTQPMGDRDIRLIRPFALANRSGDWGLRSYIEIRTLASAYPEFTALSRLDIATLLSQDGWSRETASDPCVDIYRLETSTTLLGLAIWGSDRGIAIMGRKTESNAHAIDTILSTLVLDAGACRWK